MKIGIGDDIESFCCHENRLRNADSAENEHLAVSILT